MDTDLYTQIREEDLLGSFDWYDKSPREIIFQQDNGIELLPWPAQSADIAPIEHLWGNLKNRLKEFDHLPSYESFSDSQKRTHLLGESSQSVFVNIILTHWYRIDTEQ